MALLLCIGKIMELFGFYNDFLGDECSPIIRFCAKILWDSISVMPVVVSIVNCFRSTQLKPRLFKAFLVKIGAEYSDFVYHTELRWLSRFVTLKVKISQFLQSELGKFGALENKACDNDQFHFYLNIQLQRKITDFSKQQQKLSKRNWNILSHLVNNEMTLSVAYFQNQSHWIGNKICKLKFFSQNLTELLFFFFFQMETFSWNWLKIPFCWFRSIRRISVGGSRILIFYLTK